MAFLAATVKSGIDVVLDLSGFDRHAAGADWVLTGEGRIDEQTLHGKTIAGVLARCRRLNGPRVAAFGGSVTDSAREPLAAAGLAAAIQIHPPDDPEITPEKAVRELEAAAEAFASSLS
jgi:glycerate kinase